jgi:hypothetical protein
MRIITTILILVLSIVLTLTLETQTVNTINISTIQSQSVRTVNIQELTEFIEANSSNKKSQMVSHDDWGHNTFVFAVPALTSNNNCQNYQSIN